MIPSLFMDYVRGETLQGHVRPGGLPLDELLDLAMPLTEGLVAAHEQGVVHRDLKPSNVMVDEQGHLKILDFGLSRLDRSDPDSSLTRTAQVLGRDAGAASRFEHAAIGRVLAAGESDGGFVYFATPYFSRGSLASSTDLDSVACLQVLLRLSKPSTPTCVSLVSSRVMQRACTRL